MKIAVIEPIGIADDLIRAKLVGHEISFVDTRGFADDKLITVIENADIIIMSNRPLSAKAISACPNLKFISVAFVGIDHVHSDTVKMKQIPVKNAAGYANTAVAELVIGFMIALARKIPFNNENIRKQGVTNSGSELKGKKLGIIGLGAIGSEVMRLAQAFNMTVLAYDRKNSLSLNDVCNTADFVSIHIPLLASTKNLVNIDFIKNMKPSAFLINCARGPIIKTEDLIFALKNKMIAGAALDVFDIEPPLPTDYAILQAPNVIATPHLGFNTVEALVNRGNLTINNVLEFLKKTQ